MKNTCLVLGAIGRFGRHCADTFESHGWRVAKFRRGIDDLHALAHEADVIVFGWNPKYPDWDRDCRTLITQAIEAARVNNAMILFPGNVYVYGTNQDQVWGASTPRSAVNALGQVRIEMEQMLRQSGVKTAIIRSGDYIDIEKSGNWFDSILVKKLHKGVLTYPGNVDARHAWAYLPDVARAVVGLAEMRHQLGQFTEVSVRGYCLTAHDLAEVISRVTGQAITVKKMSWLPIRLVSPFWKMGRCLLSMSYLWDHPHDLDDTDLRSYLPEFRETPIEMAISQAI